MDLPLRRNRFDDSLVREAAIEFFQKVLKLKFESNTNKTAIDLISPKNKNHGAELEHGGWEGDFWSNKTYSTISNLGYPTINIPIRKTKYWFDKVNGLYLSNGQKNYFLRSNLDFSQMIVIKPRTVKNHKKIIWSEFKPNNSFSTEQWMSFRQCDVDTYDLINGSYKLRTKKK